MLAALLLGCVLSSEPALPSVAVFPITAGPELHAQTAQFFTDRVIEDLRKSGKFSRVVGTGEVLSALSLEQQKQMLNCEADSCVAEISGALHVDRIVSGSIGKLADRYAVTLKMFEARSGASVQSLTRTMALASDVELIESADGLVDELLGNAPARELGVAEISDEEAPQDAPVWPVFVALGGLGVVGAGLAVALLAGGVYGILSSIIADLNVRGMASGVRPEGALFVVGAMGTLLVVLAAAWIAAAGAGGAAMVRAKTTSPLRHAPWVLSAVLAGVPVLVSLGLVTTFTLMALNIVTFPSSVPARYAVEGLFFVFWAIPGWLLLAPVAIIASAALLAVALATPWLATPAE